MRKVPLLAAIAIFLLLVPWIETLEFELGMIQVDVLTTSAVIVMLLSVSFSIMSWLILSWLFKCIIRVGILLSIITAAASVIPFIGVLGPVAGVLVGIVAGFSAFMLQKKVINSTNNRPVVIACLAIAAVYVGLLLLVLAVQIMHPVVDVWSGTAEGVEVWSGTAEGVEESGLITSNIKFIYFLVTVPSFVAAGLVLWGRR